MEDDGAEQHGGISIAFRDWLSERAADLPVHIVVGTSTPTVVESTFQGWPELECSLTAHGLDVAAMKDGECWDLLLSLDVAPVERGSEGACSICEAEGRTERFSSREAMWRDHLLQPLEEWIVGKLAAAERIESHQAGSGSTWARLVDPPEPAVAGSAGGPYTASRPSPSGKRPILRSLETFGIARDKRHP